MNCDDVNLLVEAMGQGDANAFHTLVEAPHTVIEWLIKDYHACADGNLRAQIVEVIWRHRQVATVSFLSNALSDVHEEVWKQALDGLVAIGGSEATATLERCLVENRADERAPWICEAIEQLNEQAQDKGDGSN